MADQDKLERDVAALMGYSDSILNTLDYMISIKVDEMLITSPHAREEREALYFGIRAMQDLKGTLINLAASNKRKIKSV